MWRHGDWVTIFDDGYSIVHGRSDATLNRAGVRIGTAEFYRVLEEIPGVADSLIVDLSSSRPDVGLLLLVVSRPDTDQEQLSERIRDELRVKMSRRHVPDRIEWVPALPRTLNGKNLEMPIKPILQGTPVERAVNIESVDRPNLLTAVASRLS